MQQKVYLQGDRIRQMEPHMTPDAAAVMWYLVQVCGGEITWDSDRQRIDIQFPESQEPSTVTERMMVWLGLAEESPEISLNQGLFPPDGPLQPPPVRLISQLHRDSLAVSERPEKDDMSFASPKTDHPAFIAAQMHRQPETPDMTAMQPAQASGANVQQKVTGERDGEQAQAKRQPDADAQVAQDGEVDEFSEESSADADRGASRYDSADQVIVQHRPLYPSREPASREDDVDAKVIHGRLRDTQMEEPGASMLTRYRPECDSRRNDG